MELKASSYFCKPISGIISYEVFIYYEKRFYDIILTLKLRHFHNNRIIDSERSHTCFCYISTFCVGIFRIKGCELLFISVVRAVEGLNVRYINSPHASFYLLSSQGIDGFKCFPKFGDLYGIKSQQIGK